MQTELQTAYTQYKNEGGHTQQSTVEVIKLNVVQKSSASTIRTTALALCYSVAEYATPIWARSHHAHLLDSELNTVCRAKTGCLKPNKVEDLFLLLGIAPPNIRRDVCAQVDKNRNHSRLTLYMIRTTQRAARSCFFSSVLLIAIQRLFAVMIGNISQR